MKLNSFLAVFTLRYAFKNLDNSSFLPIFNRSYLSYVLAALDAMERLVAAGHENGDRTPIGRATIERLRLNSPLQLAARAQWVELHLFP